MPKSKNLREEAKYGLLPPLGAENCSPVILAPPVVGIFASRFTS
jgi:hypothetical protein